MVIFDDKNHKVLFRNFYLNLHNLLELGSHNQELDKSESYLQKFQHPPNYNRYLSKSKNM
jgi:hypothetical protein